MATGCCLERKRRIASRMSSLHIGEFNCLASCALSRIARSSIGTCVKFLEPVLQVEAQYDMAFAFQRS